MGVHCPATNDDHYDLYRNSPENDYCRDGRFLTNFLAELKKVTGLKKMTEVYLKKVICYHLYKISPENKHVR